MLASGTKCVVLFAIGLILSHFVKSFNKEADMAVQYNLPNIAFLNARTDNLWMNLGYHEATSFYNLAKTATSVDVCEGLVKQTFKHMPDAQEYHHLDVGIGFADQSNLYTLTFNSKYVGINVDSIQVGIGKKRFPHLDLRVMSATDLQFEDACFDVVTSIESAFHYKTREVFFGEAYRVLKPGGKLIVLDIILSDILSIWSFVWPLKVHWNAYYTTKVALSAFLTVLKEGASIPMENWVTLNQYEDSLATTGFNVSIEDISANIVYFPNERFRSNKCIRNADINVASSWSPDLGGRIVGVLSEEEYCQMTEYKAGLTSQNYAGASSSMFLGFPFMDRYIKVVSTK